MQHVLQHMFSHWAKVLKMEHKHQRHSFHFVFYTLSSGSCSCFAQSRLIDAVLPSFPYQNSETGAASLAGCPTLLLNLTAPLALMLNVMFLYCIRRTAHCFMNSCFPDPS